MISIRARIQRNTASIVTNRKQGYVMIIMVMITYMLIIQYPMQYSGPPRSISHLFSVLHEQSNGGSTSTIRVAFHALPLPSRH